MKENEIGRIVVDAALKVHRELGPGLLDSVYEVVLIHELQRRGLKAERQVPVSITYQGLRFDEASRADIIVDGKVILELKSVETVTNAHKKQLLTYLRLTGRKLGFLLNFAEALMKDGITRIVNGLDEDWQSSKLLCALCVLAGVELADEHPPRPLRLCESPKPSHPGSSASVPPAPSVPHPSPGASSACRRSAFLWPGRARPWRSPV